MTRITVLIADDDPMLRAAIADLVSSEPDLELVATAGDADEAIAAAVRTRPDVAVIDVTMPGGGGVRAARRIIEESPGTRIVAYSAHDERGIVLDMLGAGATSYLLKGAPAGEVISTLLRAANGVGVLSPEITGGVLDELASRMRQTDREREDQVRLHDRVQRTIDEHRFASIFQPIVDLGALRVVGFEALSRFSDSPVEDPDRWFADADSAGLRAELEVATARAALTRLDDLEPSLWMSVNFSPETVPSCRQLMDPAPGERLVIEITEHAAIDDYEELSAQVKALRARGTRLAVDDAGAGFASLRHILQLMPDFIKLDVSLTKGIDRDRGRRALAAGLIGFAHELNADITAEGIETKGELDTLRALGVRFGQGYYLAAPGPLPPAAEQLSVAL